MLPHYSALKVAEIISRCWRGCTRIGSTWAWAARPAPAARSHGYCSATAVVLRRMIFRINWMSCWLI